MSDDNMDTRLSKAEWRLEALESSQQRQDARMAALGWVNTSQGADFSWLPAGKSALITRPPIH